MAVIRLPEGYARIRCNVHDNGASHTAERNLTLLLAPTSKQPETKLQETFRSLDKVLESPQRTFPFSLQGGFWISFVAVAFDKERSGAKRCRRARNTECTFLWRKVRAELLEPSCQGNRTGQHSRWSKKSHSEGASKRMALYLPQEFLTWSISMVSHPLKLWSGNQPHYLPVKMIFYLWMPWEKQKPGTFSKIMYTANANPRKSLPCSKEGKSRERRICSGKLSMSLFIDDVKRRQACFLGCIKILV